MFLFAKRYLFSPKSHSVINVIASLSLLSLLSPVAAVIVLLSIFNGFGSLAASLSTSIDSELRISPTEGQYFEISELEQLAQHEAIASSSYLLEGTLMVEYNSRETVLKVRGVDENFGSVSTLGDHIYDGKFETELGDLDRIILGNAAAYKLRAGHLRGPMLTLYALSSSPLMASLPVVSYNSREVKLGGRFQLDIESEERYAFSSLRLMQQMMQRPEQATHLDLRLREGANINKVKGELEQQLGEKYTIRSREQLSASLYSIIKYEKWAIIFISAMVIMLASFSLIGTLSMLIIEKRKEFTTLRAMGASWRMIRRIFWMEGALISAVAIGAGALLGIVMALVQQHWGIIEIPSDSFMVKAYPVLLSWGDVVMTMLLSLVISLALSYIVVKRMIK